MQTHSDSKSPQILCFPPLASPGYECLSVGAQKPNITINKLVMETVKFQKTSQKLKKNFFQTCPYRSLAQKV